MVVTSPGLDELTTLLAKRRAEEDAITLELERRRAEVADDVAALERAIQLLLAEHTGEPSPALVHEALQVPQPSASAHQAADPTPVAHDAAPGAQEAVAADLAPTG